MSVIIHKDTKIIIQGFTGKMGTFHAEEMIKYGSNVVGGVTPGKGGQKHLDRPVFDTVKDAVKNTGATASILFVPPAFAADSAMEAADAGIKTCVAIVDGIPSHDMIKLAGGEPANFLDVGGGATPEKIVKAFRLITMDKKVKVILVNIFAGINRCDWVAEGIVQALEKIEIKVPLVIRLAGTNVEKGNKILKESKLNYIEASTLEEAANKAVAALK